jgi:hypothetical protein
MKRRIAEMLGSADVTAFPLLKTSHGTTMKRIAVS